VAGQRIKAHLDRRANQPARSWLNHLSGQQLTSEFHLFASLFEVAVEDNDLKGARDQLNVEDRSSGLTVPMWLLLPVERMIGGYGPILTRKPAGK
jgi:hypothetical protein